MLFSQSIPDSVLENSAASKFVSVLDSLQEHKQGIITDAVRSLNPILSTNEKWLRKYLTDYGFSEIPKGFPIRVMQQMLLNADTIMRLRGSQLGVEFFLSVCCLGEATVNSSRVYTPLEYIFLNSLGYGYVTSSKPNEVLTMYGVESSEWSYVITDAEDRILYGEKTDGTIYEASVSSDIKRQISEVRSGGFLFLCDTNKLVEDSYLSITIRSKYFNGSYPIERAAIESYLKGILPNYIGFTSDLSITWNFRSRDKFYYHGLLNPQYVNTRELLFDADEFQPIFGGVVQSNFGQTTQGITKPLTGKPIL